MALLHKLRGEMVSGSTHPGIGVHIRDIWDDPFRVGYESVKFCQGWGFLGVPDMGWFLAWDGSRLSLAREFFPAFQALLDSAWGYMDETYSAPGHKWGVDDFMSWGLLPQANLPVDAPQ